MNNKLTIAQKKELLASKSLTPQGRKYVASVINKPLRQYKDNYSLLGEVLMVDRLSKGEIPSYEIEDYNHNVYAIAENGEVLTWTEHQNQIIVPMAEITTKDMVKRSQLRARKYDVTGRLKKKVRSDISGVENHRMFTLLSKVADHLIDATNGFELSHINKAISTIEEEGNTMASAILMNPYNFKVVRDAFLNARVFDPNTNDEMLKTGRLGKFLGAKILVSSNFNKDEVLVVAEPEELGVAVFGQTLETLPVDDTDSLKIGYVAYEELGMYIHGSSNVAKIKLS